MKVIIEISKEDYNRIKEDACNDLYHTNDIFILANAIKNGISAEETEELPEELKEELSQFIKDFKKGVNNEH